MHELAPGVYQLRGFPPNAINIYVLGDVLIDAGMPYDAGRILKQTANQALTAHALTHAHPDHMGASHAVCERLGIPLLCGEGDAATAELGDMTPQYNNPDGFVAKLSGALVKIQGHPVERTLQEGSAVADFEVLATPGHTLGHLAFWRARDRVLILGDALFNMNPLTTIPGLREPVRLFTMDPVLARKSARKLAQLEPAIIGFGHGPVLRKTATFVKFVEGLPAD